MYQHKVMCGSYRAEKRDNSSHTSRLSKYARKGLKEVAFSFPLNDMNTGEIDDEAKREKIWRNLQMVKFLGVAGGRL